MSLREDLIKLGVPETDFSNHRSDLYVKKSKIVDEYLEGYEHKENVKAFTDDIDGDTWYDIPFAHDYKKDGNL